MKEFTIHTILVPVILFSSLCCHSQREYFRLTGEIKGIDTGSVNMYSLFHDSTKQNSFSGRIYNGKFVIEGKIDIPIKVFLILNNSVYTEEFFIEPGNQNIYFNAIKNDSSYHSMRITGSLINDEYMNSYEKPLAPFYDSLDNYYEILDSLDKSFEDGIPSTFEDICNHINITNKDIDSVKKAFIIGHPSSFVSLWALYNDISFLQNLEFVVNNFQYLVKHLQNNPLGKYLAQRMEVEKIFLNGNFFPSIQIVDSSEKKVKLQNVITGKYTLIDFWFSHCGPCIVQFPFMRNLYARYQDAGFDVIGISIDKGADKKYWLGAIAKHELNWKQFWDIDGKEAEKYFIDTYPTNFLLNSEGKILKKNILPEELEILIKNGVK